MYSIICTVVETRRYKNDFIKIILRTRIFDCYGDHLFKDSFSRLSRGISVFLQSLHDKSPIYTLTGSTITILEFIYCNGVDRMSCKHFG